MRLHLFVLAFSVHREGTSERSFVPSSLTSSFNMDWDIKYKNSYGIPSGRPKEVSLYSLDKVYERLEQLDGAPHSTAVGSCNQGVFLVKQRKTGRKCVQKRISGEGNTFVREIHLLHCLKHPNVINFIDAHVPADSTSAVSTLSTVTRAA